MTAGRASGTQGESGQPRSMPLLIAAAVLVVAVVAAVLVFGVKRPPPLPPVSDTSGPLPPVSVAWAGGDGDERCVHVARPDGTVTEIRCDAQGGEVLGWADDRLLLLDGSGRVAEIDPVTGTVMDVREAGGDGEPPGPPTGRAVTSYFRDGDLVVELEGTQLWRVAAPDDYDIRSSSVSPDGDFVVMTDTADRLLVMPADGSHPPHVWASEVQSWTVPVWEGQVGQNAFVPRPAPESGKTTTMSSASAASRK